VKSFGACPARSAVQRRVSGQVQEALVGEFDQMATESGSVVAVGGDHFEGSFLPFAKREGPNRQLLTLAQ